MSGGHFNDCGYDYYKVAQCEKENKVLNNAKQGIEEYKEALQQLVEIERDS